ncbi:MAG: endonuclease/exonuclease/phosphatase family protein [Anaerolineae bacterium]
MTDWQKGRILRLVRLLETAAVLLFFYQALRVLFSLLFGLIYDALIAGQASMVAVGGVMAVVVLALLAPLAVRREAAAGRLTMLAAALTVFVARVALTFDHFELRLGAAIVIMAATGLYLAARLRRDGGQVAYGLILALVADQLLRAAGHTTDPTLRPVWWPGQALVSLAFCLVSVGLAWQQRLAEPDPGPRLGLRAGLVWGGWLFLQTALLAFPNALARWSGESYLLFAFSWPFVLLLTLLGSDLWRTRRGWSDGLLVLLALLGGLAAGYLLGGALAFLGLLLAHLAAVFALFSAFPGREQEAPAPHAEPGLVLALGNVLFFVLHLAYAFTFTYAYTLDLFRGLGLPIFAVAALLVGVPLLWLPARPEPAEWPSTDRWFTVWGTGALVCAFVLAVGAPRPNAGAAAGGTIRAMTYNIHYGYDREWHQSLEEQARTIEAADADVVMLQEVDAGRPTSYMVDNALWLAQRLGMRGVYRPTIEHLTGIALLSRYPLLESGSMLLTSELERTGIIWVQVDAAEPGAPEPLPVNAFATWLGLEPEERARQLDDALPFVAAHAGPALFGGDFNSQPDSPVYARIAGAGFVDPFPALGLDPPPTDPAVDPDKRIDFVWLRELEPLAAEVPDSAASDHRPVVIEAVLP